MHNTIAYKESKDNLVLTHMAITMMYKRRIRKKQLAKALMTGKKSDIGGGKIQCDWNKLRFIYRHDRDKRVVISVKDR